MVGNDENSDKYLCIEIVLGIIGTKNQIQWAI